jgi:hypothetical protein
MPSTARHLFPQPDEVTWRRPHCEVIEGCLAKRHGEMSESPMQRPRLKHLLVEHELFLAAEQYEPLRHPELVWEFAELQRDASSLQAFSCRWGPLGGYLQRDYWVAVPDTEDGRRMTAESVQDWRREVRRARIFVRILKLVSSEVSKDLRDIFSIEVAQLTDGRTVSAVCISGQFARRVTRLFLGKVMYADYKRWLLPLREVTETAKGTERAKHAEDAEMRLAARTLCGLMADHMLERCHVRPAIGYDSGDQPSSIWISPPSLIACIWLQFARMAVGELDFVFCQHCKRPITLAKERNVRGVRSDRIFCDKACKQAAYRVKVKEAIYLRANGMSVQDIAVKLDSDLATVKKWVEEVPKAKVVRKKKSS